MDSTSSMRVRDYSLGMRQRGAPRVVERVAMQRDIAPLRAQQAQQQPDGGGLAGAVGPEEADDLTRLDREADAPDRDDVAMVALDETLRRRLQARVADRDLEDLGEGVDVDSELTGPHADRR